MPQKSEIASWIGSVQGAVATWSNHRVEILREFACRSLTRSLPLPVLTRSNNDFRLLGQSPTIATVCFIVLPAIALSQLALSVRRERLTKSTNNGYPRRRARRLWQMTFVYYPDATSRVCRLASELRHLMTRLEVKNVRMSPPVAWNAVSWKLWPKSIPPNREVSPHTEAMLSPLWKNIIWAEPSSAEEIDHRPPRRNSVNYGK